MDNLQNNEHPAAPYIVPFGTFIVLTALIPYIPHGQLWGYPIKTAIVGGLLLFFASDYGKPQALYLWFATIIGVAVFLIWIAPEGLYPLLEESTPFDPYAHLSGYLVIAWIAVRLLGASIVVPIMEEFFWRGFLLRWLIQQDFNKVAIGTFTWPSFLITTLLFGLEHQRWLVGIIAGIIYNLLLYRTKSIWACVVAHAITNLTLGIYVIATGQWQFW